MNKLILFFVLVFAHFSFAVAEKDYEKIRALIQKGDYQQAASLARAELAKDKNSTQLLNLLGELQFEIGELNSAEQRFRRVIELSTTNNLTAKLNLARVYLYRGELQSAESLFLDIRSAYRSINTLSGQDLYAIASAVRYLGKSDPQLFKEAVRIFGEASQYDGSILESPIALGELLLEKYNNKEALEVFLEVLKQDDKHPRALLGLARSQHFDYSSIAMLTVRRALQINPNFVSARVFLSRLYFELEQYALAEKEAELALEVNPVSLEALSMLAAVYHLVRNPVKFERIEKRVLELNPNYAQFYIILADLAARNRLYRDAEKFAKKAVALDSKSWKGYGLLGMNQLRLGQIAEGRASLNKSFNGDPYNIWIKNTLELVDTFKDYTEIKQGQFLVVLHKKEEALLSEYIFDLANRAYIHFNKRYKYELKKPVRLELYPDHADFSVRSVGLAGVGLLGVSFGPVVAMDSPSARQRGQFNWGSTLWHEIAHVFHLSMTKNRVPRWFSEGLAVYEERASGQGWGGDITPEFLLAYLEGRLLPVSELNNGFIRPSYPEQVMYSYFQASLVFEFIEKRWGFGAIRQMLNAFRASKNNDEVIANVLRLDIKSFDDEFDAYFKVKYSVALEALGKNEEQKKDTISGIGAKKDDQTSKVPDRYYDQLDVGKLLYEKGDLSSAESFLKRAQQLFPDYAGNDSSYWILAELYNKQGKLELVEEQLTKMISINAENYQAHVRLATLRAKLGDIAGAAEVLNRAVYIYPFDLDLHKQLALYYSRLGSWNIVARERRAVLALDPVDKAEAYFQLAHAYNQAGDRASARKEILFSLEIAPNFYQAQELLLSLTVPETAVTGQK